MAYADVSDVESGFRELSVDEQSKALALLDEAEIIIDAYNADASANAKKLVSCRMVRRMLGDDSMASIPMGATQGSMSALGYTQSWTIGSGSAGEAYLSKLDKKVLGIGNRIGSHSPVESTVESTVESDD